MSTKEEQKSKIEGSGRNKGTLNKIPKLLKDAILEAAERAGQTIVEAKYSNPDEADQRFVEQAKKDGMVNYLEHQAIENPQSFLTLMGKVLPLQVTGSGNEGEHVITYKWLNDANQDD